MSRKVTLSEMQDIGGCRAVVSSVAKVREIVAMYKQKRRGARHLLDDEDDYITNPKSSGYRSYHLIYRYQARGKRGAPYNGRKIEIQIRSDLQHWWATAVETVSTFQRQSLKSRSGDKKWLRFFELVSAAFAMREGTPPVPNTPLLRPDLIAELRTMTDELQVEAKLETYAEGLNKTEELRKNSRHFVVTLIPGERTVTVTGFVQQEQAMKEYLASEEKIKELPGAEAVMVSARSIDDVLRGYPSYFIDTKRFLAALRKEIDQ